MVDKGCILQIFGSLMKEPQLLSQTDKYRLVVQDFSTVFEQYIFSAIYNLYNSGAERITVVDVDNYLATHPSGKIIFAKENGIEYLQDAEELSQVENFPFYYNRFKKFNCLKDLKKMGHNISNIYEENQLNPNVKEINERFEEMNVTDIINAIKTPIIKLEADYGTGEASTVEEAYSGIEELVKELQRRPEIGPNLQGEIFNTVVRGARSGKFYIRSSFSGGGKTRFSVGDACHLAYPVMYNTIKQRWEYSGATEKVLFIATEQEGDEIQTLILAYLTGINEESIIYGQFTDEERIIVSQAIYIMKEFRKNFIIVRLSNPNIAQLRAVVRQQYIVNGIQNVFYDYIFSSPSLLNEFRDLRIREDVVLTMLSTALKDLAVEMGLFIMSSTQTNSTEEESKGIKNQKAIRGAKGIIDKCDVACILGKVSQEELELLNPVIEKGGIVPNRVVDVYKVRRGRYTDVRIWSVADLGTCRRKDLFITDDRFNEVPNFKRTSVLFEQENMKEINKLLQYLNNGEEREGIVEYKDSQNLELNIGNIENIETEEERIESTASNLLKEHSNEEGLFGGLL